MEDVTSEDVLKWIENYELLWILDWTSMSAIKSLMDRAEENPDLVVQIIVDVSGRGALRFELGHAENQPDGTRNYRPLADTELSGWYFPSDKQKFFVDGTAFEDLLSDDE